ncbi:hypothetical protein DFP74_3435 [Nocardiopsis sp. Huas11]|uniref:hypothetical protein n=1 Tax=Nocardiopsis sp. Huas11 TaxID=2183912 RepID=UPI000EAFFDB1|nr:hypothetical protein [Nocardiopsis sp. Huas11]RKS07751.1 hypothetical protein DFP74_3435 [Nocardiopsis sp. Huas11]
MSTHHCSAWELFGSTAFLRAFTRVMGCGPCSTDGTAQGCSGHSEQFCDYVDLCAEHCPCPVHQGDAESVLAVRMGRAVPRDGTVDRTAAHRLRDALDDVRRDRSYKNLRRVYPQHAANGTVRCAFSERPRRWAQRRDVARVATDVVEQEALAMLVLTAGWGNPAADLPEEIHQGENASFTEDGSAVPVADLHGRALTAVKEPPMVSTATGDYLLRKLAELAGGRDADPGRTPDQRRRLLLRRMLPTVSGEDVARRLTGVLGRMAVDMPDHFRLVQQARGRARSAPYTPVPDTAAPRPDARTRREVLDTVERGWLERTARTLADRAQREREAFDADPQGALDTLLCDLLDEEGRRGEPVAHAGTAAADAADAATGSATATATLTTGVPARWAGAQDDADLRADLLEALAEAIDG